MPNTVTMAQLRRNHESNTSIMPAINYMLKTFALIFFGFAFGATMTLTKTVLDDIQMKDDVRKLSTAVDEPTSPILRGPAVNRDPQTLPQPVRDGTNGRKWIYPTEKESIKERLQLVENHLHSLKSTPPAAPQQQVQQKQPQPPQNSITASAAKRPRTMQDIEYCRKHVFVTQREGVTEEELDKTCNSPEAKRFNVCHDLADFTGLAMEEVIVRMARLDHFHFEEEHMFWNPQTATQLAWYYSTSQSYLFANSIHPPRTGVLDRLQKGIHEPVLDYSGGVGNTVLYLALDRGMKCQYFGIGMIEKSFAQFRVAKRGLEDMVTFLNPWSEGTSWKFDPIQALPRDGSLGAILATDVLEHIPEYHHTVAAMVDSLKVGGVIVERTPFAESPISGGKDVDTRIHVHNGGITIEQAMGDRMVYRKEVGYWEKIKG